MNNEFQNGGFSGDGVNPVPQQPVQQPVPQQPIQQPVSEQPVQQVAAQPAFSQPVAAPVQPVQQPMMQQPVQQPGGGFNTMGAVPAQPAGKGGNKLPIIIAAAVAGLLFFVLLISVVTTKTLKCTNEEESLGMSIKATQVVKFKFGKVKSYKEDIVLDYSDVEDDYKEYVDQLVESFEEKAKDECKSGCKYSSSNKNGVLKITLSVKANASGFKSITGFSKSISYKDLQEENEDDGYTCK